MASGGAIGASLLDSRPETSAWHGDRASLKVLVVNYRYFVSGGPERYLFNVTDLLERKGHEVVPFSVTYSRNVPTPFARYFASPIGDGEQVYFRDHRNGVKTAAKGVARAFYSREVYKKLAALVADEQPDVALVLHYLRKLSPSVLTCLRDHGIPFVVRMSDFGMLCPNAHLYREGRACELCAGGSLRHSVRHRCVQGSVGASAVNYAATRFHQAAGYYDLIQKFAVPSAFTLEKMAAAGFERTRLAHVPTFVVIGADVPGERPPVVTYVGRLDELKGARLLLESARILAEDPSVPEHVIRIIGSGDPSYAQSLHDFVERHALGNVSFAGALSEAEVRAALRGSRCSVTPTLWYDNMPNSALESMAEGTPVVAPDHGCFPEIVRDGESGVLFRAGDARALAEALRRMLMESAEAEAMGRCARAFVGKHHSPDLHYDRLLGAFDEIASRKIAA